jgi:hypothetical protein
MLARSLPTGLGAWSIDQPTPSQRSMSAARVSVASMK